MRVVDSEAGVAFFVTCVGRLVHSASDYIDRTLEAVSQAAAVEQSADETVEPLPSVEPLGIEGLTYFYLCTYLMVRRRCR